MIRPATATDIPHLQAIEVDAGEPFRAVGLDAVADDDPPASEDLLAHVRTGTAWVASDPGDARDLLGYAVVSVVDGEGHLDQVSVRPRAMGRGIGSALLEHACAWSAAAGHPALTLTTFRDVPWNGPWYARRGFREIPDGTLGPGLRAIRDRERASGIEVAPRIAMRRAHAKG